MFSGSKSLLMSPDALTKSMTPVPPILNGLKLIIYNRDIKIVWHKHPCRQLWSGVSFVRSHSSARGRAKGCVRLWEKYERTVKVRKEDSETIFGCWNKNNNYSLAKDCGDFPFCPHLLLRFESMHSWDCRRSPGVWKRRCCQCHQGGLFHAGLKMQNQGCPCLSKRCSHNNKTDVIILH